MIRTDRFWGFLSTFAAIGGLGLWYLIYAPTYIAQFLDVSRAIAYQLTMQILVLVTLILSVVYLSVVIKQETSEVVETVNQAEAIPDEFFDEIGGADGEDEGTEDGMEDEPIRTDGGTDGRGLSEPRHPNESARTTDDEFAYRLRNVDIRPSGRGALIGMLVGGVIGFVFGTAGILIGGIGGSLVGNEMEYQVIKQKRRHLLDYIELPDEADQDVLFDILKNRRRRDVLRLLFEEEDSTATLRELAEAIAASEAETSVDDLSSDELKRVYVALYQTHLPKLADAGLIEYDQDRGVIDLTEQQGPTLAHSKRPDLLVFDLKPYEYYLVVTGLALVLHVATVVDAITLSTDLLLLGYVGAVIVVTVAVHLDLPE